MGEFFAISCGAVWALAVILLRKSGESVPPFQLNLFRTVLSSLMLFVTLVVLGKPVFADVAREDVLILMASGVIAIAISDTLFLMCLNRVGAGLNAIVDATYSPFVILWAYALLGERLQPVQYAGMVLIISGVVVASWVAPPHGTSRATLVAGILYGIGAMATISFGIVLAKPALTRTDVIWATAVRQFGAMIALGAVALIRPDRRSVFSTFLPSDSWRFTVPATVLGSYVALTLWIAGMKYTAETGTAGILNQTSTLFILVLASLFLKEKFTRRKALAALLSVAGIVLTVV